MEVFREDRERGYPALVRDVLPALCPAGGPQIRHNKGAAIRLHFLER